MPRIQTFISNKAKQEIDTIVAVRRQDGAMATEATVSSVTAMLIELGLRVHRIQQESKDSSFNQLEYNRIMLESMLRVRAMCTELLRMSALHPEVIATGVFELHAIQEAIKRYSMKQTQVFFPESE